jgi:molybdopterin-guanine dinucleotide biosynthesis protein A
MLSLVIQAGGESRRMGQDKALKPFLGRPLIARVLERLAPLADEVMVTTNRPDAFSFLGVTLVPDLKPGRGALGGLHTAIASASYRLVAVVACDMPFASRELFAFQRDLLEAEAADVVIPPSGHGYGYEPLHAVYRREQCLSPIEAALAADDLKLIAWFPKVKVRTLTPDELSRYDPEHLAFWNLNTPEEFAQAEQRARTAESGSQGA